MKHWPSRDPRTTVRLTARIRADGGWIDATIHNVSQRGMMVRSQYPLRRNQFVEVARGPNRVIARIVWTADSASGLRAQDVIDLAALLDQPASTRAASRDEVRRLPRPASGSFASLSFAQRADVSRGLGRRFELAVMIAAITGTATLLVEGAFDAASEPLQQVRIALGPEAA